jgi:hypothetical protein
MDYDPISAGSEIEIDTSLAKAPFLLRAAVLFAGMMNLELSDLLRIQMTTTENTYIYDVHPTLYGTYTWVMNLLIHGGILHIRNRQVPALHSRASISHVERCSLLVDGKNINPFHYSHQMNPKNEGVELAFIACMVAYRVYSLFDIRARRRTCAEMIELRDKLRMAIQSLIDQLHAWNVRHDVVDAALVSDKAYAWCTGDYTQVGLPNDEEIHEEPPIEDYLPIRLEHAVDLLDVTTDAVTFNVTYDVRDVPCLTLRLAHLFAGLKKVDINKCVLLRPENGGYMLTMLPPFYAPYLSAIAFVAYSLLELADNRCTFVGFPENRNLLCTDNLINGPILNPEEPVAVDHGIELALASYMAGLAVYGQYDSLSRRKTRYEIHDLAFRTSEAAGKLAAQILRWDTSRCEDEGEEAVAMIKREVVEQLFPWLNV